MSDQAAAEIIAAALRPLVKRHEAQEHELCHLRNLVEIAGQILYRLNCDLADHVHGLSTTVLPNYRPEKRKDWATLTVEDQAELARGELAAQRTAAQETLRDVDLQEKTWGRRAEPLADDHRMLGPCFLPKERPQAAERPCSAKGASVQDHAWGKPLGEPGLGLVRTCSACGARQVLDGGP